MKTLTLLLLNTFTFILTLLFNFLSSTGQLTGKTVGQVSQNLSNLLTPASYAFSIWGLIYFMLILYLGYQWYEYIKYKDSDITRNSDIWFTISNIANAMWLVSWVSNYILLSVFMMIILLLSLTMLVLKNNLEIWDAPVRIIMFVWWPICFYFGWVILATVVNISAYLVFIGINFDTTINSVISIAVMGVATSIYLLLIVKRNLREASLIAVWGLVAIAIKQLSITPVVSYSAFFFSLVLLSASGIHAIKNFRTTPIEKLKRGEF